MSGGRSRQPSGGVVFYDSKKSSGTKQILSSKAANHKNRKTPKKWAKMRQRLQTMFGYETVARSEKTHVFRCREIKTMRLNLKKRLCTSPVAAGTRYQRHFKRLHRLLLLFSRPNGICLYFSFLRLVTKSVRVREQWQRLNFPFGGKKKKNLWIPQSPHPTSAHLNSDRCSFI